MPRDYHHAVCWEAMSASESQGSPPPYNYEPPVRELYRRPLRRHRYPQVHRSRRRVLMQPVSCPNTLIPSDEPSTTSADENQWASRRTRSAFPTAATPRIYRSLRPCRRPTHLCIPISCRPEPYYRPARMRSRTATILHHPCCLDDPRLCPLMAGNQQRETVRPETVDSSSMRPTENMRADVESLIQQYPRMPVQKHAWRQPAPQFPQGRPPGNNSDSRFSHSRHCHMCGNQQVPENKPAYSQYKHRAPREVPSDVADRLLAELEQQSSGPRKRASQVNMKVDELQSCGRHHTPAPSTGSQVVGYSRPSDAKPSVEKREDEVTWIPTSDPSVLIKQAATKAPFHAKDTIPKSSEIKPTTGMADKTPSNNDDIEEDVSFTMNSIATAKAMAKSSKCSVRAKMRRQANKSTLRHLSVCGSAGSSKKPPEAEALQQLYVPPSTATTTDSDHEENARRGEHAILQEPSSPTVNENLEGELRKIITNIHCAEDNTSVKSEMSNFAELAANREESSNSIQTVVQATAPGSIGRETTSSRQRETTEKSQGSNASSSTVTPRAELMARNNESRRSSGIGVGRTCGQSREHDNSAVITKRGPESGGRSDGSSPRRSTASRDYMDSVAASRGSDSRGVSEVSPTRRDFNDSAAAVENSSDYASPTSQRASARSAVDGGGNHTRFLGDSRERNSEEAELEVSRSEVMKVIDQALSPIIPATPLSSGTPRLLRLDAGEAINLVEQRAGSPSSLTGALCQRIGKTLTDALVDNHRPAVPSSNEEQSYYQLLRQLRWDHINNIRNDLLRLEDIERSIDSLKLDTSVNPCMSSSL